MNNRNRSASASKAIPIAVIVLLAISPIVRAESVIYVSASATGSMDGSTWKDAFTDLAVAIDLSEPGQQLWVAAGTYHPDMGTGSKDLSFMLKDGVSIFGGFNGDEVSLDERSPTENMTVLSGDLAGNDGPAKSTKLDNSRHVVQALGVSDSAILDGVIVRAGVGGLGGDAITPSGGGIFVVDGSPRFVGVVIENNEASVGAGIYSTDGNPTFSGCTIRHNVSSYAGAMMFSGAGSTTLMSCLIQDNSAKSQDGAMRCDGDYGLEINDCAFIGNSSQFGAGVGRLSTVAPVCIRRSRFVSNVGPQCSGMIIGEFDYQSSLLLEDSEFIGNKGDSAGVFSALRTKMDVNRCSFYGNMSAAVGSCIAGVSANPSIPTQLLIRNSIFWNNPGGDSITDSSQIATNPLFASIESSCIEGNTGTYGGDGQTVADPMFLAPLGADGVLGTADDDLRLSSESPLIDAGTFDEAYGLDVAGFPRWIDGNLDRKLRVDLGAHEFSNVELTVSKLGDAIEVSVVATPDLLGMLFVGRQFGESLVVPYGGAFIDFDAGWCRWFLGKLPIVITVPATTAATVGDGFVLQALGYRRAVAGSVGNWSNPILLGNALKLPVR